MAFSKALIWGLVGPFAGYLLVPVAAVVSDFIPQLKGAGGVILLIAVLVHLGALGVAITKLAREASYRSKGNVILVGISAAPWILVGAFIVAAFFGGAAYRLRG